MVSKNLVLPMISLVFLSFQAQAAAPGLACVASDMSKIKAILQHDSTVGVFGNSLAPATAYEGLNQAQLSRNSGSAGVQAHLNEVDGRIQMAVNEFLATKADPGQTALAVLGHPDRRQFLQILRRPKNQPGVAANSQTKCNASSCEDMAVKTQMLYILSNTSVAKTVGELGIYKLRATGQVDAFFCEASAGCHDRNQLLRAGGVVQMSKTPPAMKPETPYMLRTIGMGAETTSVYKVHPTTICGKPAAVMTGILVKGENAFDSSSTIAVAVESDDRVMLFAHYQGYVAGGRGKVPKWMLNGGIVGAIAMSSLNGIYNKQADFLGSPDHVDGRGMLK